MGQPILQPMKAEARQLPSSLLAMEQLDFVGERVKLCFCHVTALCYEVTFVVSTFPYRSLKREHAQDGSCVSKMNVLNGVRFAMEG